MFNLDLFIINSIKSIFSNIGSNYMLALYSLKYVILLGIGGIGVSNVIEIKNKNKKRR